MNINDILSDTELVLAHKKINHKIIELRAFIRFDNKIFGYYNIYENGIFQISIDHLDDAIDYFNQYE